MLTCTICDKTCQILPGMVYREKLEKHITDDVNNIEIYNTADPGHEATLCKTNTYYNPKSNDNNNVNA